MICKNCSAENAEQNRFCSSCGEKLVVKKSSLSLKKLELELEPLSEDISDYDDNVEEYYEAALGYKNIDYYLPRFNRFELQSINISWNWTAFFISFYWLLYRKMWLYALLYFLFPIPFGILIGIFSLNSDANVVFAYSLVFVVMFILFPMYANTLYYRHVNKKILKIKNRSNNKEKQLRILVTEGGTSWAPLIILIITPFIVGMLAAIAIPAYQDYTTRARISEGLVLAKDYQHQVDTYFSLNQKLPNSNIEIEMTEEVATSYIASISVIKNGKVVITYANNEQINGKSIVLTPSVNDENSIVWKCNSADFTKKIFLPPNCRN